MYFLITKNGYYAILARSVAALFSSLISTSFTYPLDVMRVKISTDLHKPPMYNGLIDAIKKTVQHQGISSLYKGFLITNLGVIPYTVTSLTIYDLLR